MTISPHMPRLSFGCVCRVPTATTFSDFGGFRRPLTELPLIVGAEIVTAPGVQELFYGCRFFGPQHVSSGQFLDARTESVFVEDTFQMLDIR
jgi:hypothetical protein